jgi:hypothetical protein
MGYRLLKVILLLYSHPASIIVDGYRNKLSHVVVNGGTGFTNKQKIDTNTANSTNIIAQLCIITSMNFISYLLSNKKEISLLPSLQLIDDNNLECLPFDLFVHHVLPFVGSDQYMYNGNFSQEFQNEYHTAEYIPKGIKMNSSVLLSGNLNFLRYIWCTRSCRWDSEFCSKSAANGHFEILQWAHANGCQLHERASAYAARSGRLEILQWVRSNGCPWDAFTCSCAAANGHLEILQWAHVNGCPWNEDTCRGAAECGNLKMLQWARARGCPWDEDTCAMAAAYGHLEILQWAHVNGCPWNEDTCICAAQYGYFKLLRWAHVNGCPWDIRVCYSVVEWFCCCEGI